MSTAVSETSKADLVKVNTAAPMKNEGSVAQLLIGYQKKFQIVAPKHLDVSRMLRVALNTVSRSRELLECTGASLLGAFMLATQLGLDIAAKEAWLVPFKNRKTGLKEVQLVPDYRGLLKLVRNSGQVINMRAAVVYHGEFCDWQLGLHQKLEHTPDFDIDRSDKNIRCVYSIAVFGDENRRPTGYEEFQVLPLSHFIGIRAKSPAGGSGPWVDYFAEMCIKTMIKHHIKLLPQSVELAQALVLDNRAEMGMTQGISLTAGVDAPQMAELPLDDDREESPDITATATTGKAKGKLDELAASGTPPPPPPPPPDQHESRGHISLGDAPTLVRGGGDAPLCTDQDMMDIATLAGDAGVPMKQVHEHVTVTMGFKEYRLLTKERSGEVHAWIKAKAKK